MNPRNWTQEEISIPSHIIIKFLKSNDKEKNLQSNQQKRYITYRRYRDNTANRLAVGNDVRRRVEKTSLSY